ncbi:MAG TPA: carbamate kinase [Victivallales bacterium]|nr:carbamate kinase [Victivallales bacterium]
MGKLAIIAIGGNSLIRDKKHQTIADQFNAVCETTKHITDLVEQGYDVVISHGNGPQVGFILRRSEIAAEYEQMHEVPLVSCDADSQGAIGYQIQQAMDNEFRKRDIKKDNGYKTALTVVTQVAVSKDDPAFKNPAKPIGTFYTPEQAKELKEKNPDWKLIEDAGRGFRRVVPSPMPVEILEKEAIQNLLGLGYCVVAAGGGGIPVYKENNQWYGVDAVIDKDFATSLLANQLEADVLIISTGVEKVYLNFGKADQKSLDRVTVSEMKQYINEGHFAPGSMLPKIEAAVKFIENGGKETIITAPEFLGQAVKGETGTHIING